MTPAHRDALAAPCLLACETLNPRLRHIRLRHALVLSINRGYE